MDAMKAQMRDRNAKLAKDKAVRSIKLAEIQKSKLAEAAAARRHAKEVIETSDQTAEDQKKARIAHVIAKVEELQRLRQKECYSRTLWSRKQLKALQKLNDFYGLDVRKDWGESEHVESDDTEITAGSEALMAYVKGLKRVTYQNLVD